MLNSVFSKVKLFKYHNDGIYAILTTIIIESLAFLSKEVIK